MRKIILITVLMLIAAGQLAVGQDTLHSANGNAVQSEIPAFQAPAINHEASVAYEKAHNTGTLADFPRLHPLVVHFPIVFIILAFVVQIISFFVFRRELSWVSMCLIVLGFIGTFIAINLLHGGDPDLSTLSAISRKTFETHEQFAHYTLIISVIASAVKIISHFYLGRKWWSEILVAALMLGSVYCIHTTGDMGARLVHISAIGVQGNEIPLHDDD